MEFEDFIKALHSQTAVEVENVAFEKLTAEQWTTIAKAIAANSSLTKLSINYFQFRDVEAIQFAKAIAGHPALEYLSVVHTKISDEGAIALAKAVERIPTLITLVLRKHYIGKIGAAALAEVVATHPSLEVLDLEENHISDRGAKAIAGALKKNNRLKRLVLNANCIGEDGAAAIVEALEENSSLTQLGMDENHIGDDGVRLFARLLEKTNSLTELGLMKTRMGPVGSAEIVKMLRINRSLNCLFLGGNHFEGEFITAIQNAIREHGLILNTDCDSNQFLYKIIDENEIGFPKKFLAELVPLDGANMHPHIVLQRLITLHRHLDFFRAEMRWNTPNPNNQSIAVALEPEWLLTVVKVLTDLLSRYRRELQELHFDAAPHPVYQAALEALSNILVDAPQYRKACEFMGGYWLRRIPSATVGLRERPEAARFRQSAIHFLAIGNPEMAARSAKKLLGDQKVTQISKQYESLKSPTRSLNGMLNEAACGELIARAERPPEKPISGSKPLCTQLFKFKSYFEQPKLVQTNTAVAVVAATQTSDDDDNDNAANYTVTMAR